MSDQQPLSQTEFAKLAGITQGMVSRHIKRGNIPADCLVDVQENGRTYRKLIPEKALAALAENVDQSKSRRPGRPMGPGKRARPGAITYQEARALHEAVTNQLLELKLMVGRGALVDLHDVKTEAFEKARAVRDSLLQIPDRIAALVASTKNEEQIRAILSKEIGRALEALNNGNQNQNDTD